MAKTEWTMGSFAAIFNPEKELLLLKRTDGKGWNLPGGGVDFTKDAGPIAVLSREVEEETGLYYDHSYPDFVGVYPSAKLKDIALLFLLTYSKDQQGRSPGITEEAAEYRFVDRETIKREIQLVSQQYPGHEFGRHWQMVQDAFDFMEKNYEQVMGRDSCIDCGGYDHEHREYPILIRKDKA